MRFTVIGRVHPENASVWFDRIESATTGGGYFSIECRVSQLFIAFEAPDISDVDAVKITTENLAQTYVSAVGFAVGGGYTVEITHVIDADGKTQFYGPKNPGLAFDETGKILTECQRLVGQDPFFRFALIDYGKAITNQIECGFHCFRALEAIKQSFQGDWQKMHASLGTTKVEIDRIVKANADPIRHGNWSATPSTTNADRQAALVLTRDILHKYLQFRSIPLAMAGAKA